MRGMLLLCGALTFATLEARAEEAHRHLGAHEHGHGRLNIAVEGNKVAIELEAPGADIAGFEHEANTPEEKATLAAAKAKLGDALSLFTPSEAAACSLISAKVATEAGDAATGHDVKEGGPSGASHHTEFHVEYALECKSTAQLTSLTFGYFKAFPGAEELEVSLISPKGQTTFEVTRGRPRIDLTGIM